VRWSEDYATGGESDIVLMGRAMRSGQPGAVMELMRTRPRAAAPGSVFNYSTGDSYVLGAVVAAATGKRMADYLSQKVWAPLGMEADGYWLLDAPDGLEMGGNNISATLRDHGRFGLFFLRQGVVNGSRVLPDGWREQAGQPGTAVTAHGQLYPGYPLGYGYQWWSFPTGAKAIPFHEGAFTALGIFGQFLYINPAQDVVAVVWSAWRSSWLEKAEFETYTLLGTAVAMLR
jgi:CubicO group peptidase (beta-lactamase class C family)